MKRQNDGDDSDDDDEIFQYSNKEKLTFTKLQPQTKRQHILLDGSDETSSSGDDDSGSDDDSGGSSDHNDEVEDCSIVAEIKQSDSTMEDLPATPPSPPPPPPDELITVKTPPRHNSILNRLKQRLDAVQTPNSSIEIYSPSPEEETLNVKVKIHGLIKRYYIPKVPNLRKKCPTIL